jgi:hypothetical protein
LVSEHRDLIITLDSHDTGYSLTSSSFSIPFRGIEKHFGYDKELSFDINVHDLYDFRVSECQTMTLKADLNVKVYVHLDDRVELAAEWDLTHAEASFTVTMDDMNIKAHITKVFFD